MPAWAIVLIVVGVLAALGIGGCAVVAVLVGKTAEKAGNELDKGLRRVQNIDAITNQQADAVELGAPAARCSTSSGRRRAWAATASSIACAGARSATSGSSASPGSR